MSPGQSEAGIDVAGASESRPIVFVHGVVFTRKMWAPQRRALSADARIVAPDLPGHGARADGPFKLERAIGVVDDAIETHADGSAILVGLSLGGYVSTEYARRHPEKVDGLVIAGSSVNPVRGMELAARAVGGGARLARRWVNERDLPREVKDEIVDAGFYPRQFGNAGAGIAGHDFRAAFADYPGPSLVVNGERDALMRRGEKRHAAAAQDARITVIHDAGHTSNLIRPDVFTDVVRDFVERVDSTTEGRMERPGEV